MAQSMANELYNLIKKKSAEVPKTYSLTSDGITLITQALVAQKVKNDPEVKERIKEYLPYFKNETDLITQTLQVAEKNNDAPIVFGLSDILPNPRDTIIPNVNNKLLKQLGIGAFLSVAVIPIYHILKRYEKENAAYHDIKEGVLKYKSAFISLFIASVGSLITGRAIEHWGNSNKVKNNTIGYNKTTSPHNASDNKK